MAEYLINVRGAKLETLCAAAMIGDLEKLKGFFKDGRLVASVLPIYFPWGKIEESTDKDAINQAFCIRIAK